MFQFDFLSEREPQHLIHEDSNVSGVNIFEEEPSFLQLNSNYDVGQCKSSVSFEINVKVAQTKPTHFSHTIRTWIGLCLLFFNKVSFDQE